MLTDLNILDFTSTLPGPYTTMLLADLGANVLRIQNPKTPDIINILEPKTKNTSAVFDYLNRNKKIVELDLTIKNNRKKIRDLIYEYDIIIEGNRPDVMSKLNLGYEDLKKINPKIIYVSLTGYGQKGSLKDKAGHDINYLARSGIASMFRSKKDEPIIPGIQIADLMGSMYSVTSILTAVIYRNKTGKGQYIDVAMRDAVMSLAALHLPKVLISGKKPKINEHILSGGTYYGFYQTSDNKYLSVGALENKFFREFCQILDIQYTRDRFTDASIRSKIQSKIKSESLKYWLNKFQDADICVEPVQDLFEAAQHPINKIRGNIVNVEIKGETQKQFSHPVIYSDYLPRYNKLEYKTIDDILDET